MEFIIILMGLGWFLNLFVSKEEKERQARWKKFLEDNPNAVDTLTG